MTDHAEALAKALEPFVSASIDVTGSAVILGYPEAQDAKENARAALAAYRSRPAAEVVGWASRHDHSKALRQVSEGWVPDIGWSAPFPLYATPAPVAGTEPAGEVVEKRPANCRNRLRDEDQAYPKSGCAVCKTGGMTGCPHERAALRDQSEA